MAAISGDEDIVVGTVVPPTVPEEEEAKDMEPKVEIEGGSGGGVLPADGAGDAPGEVDGSFPKAPKELRVPLPPSDPAPGEEVKVVGYDTTKSAERALGVAPLTAEKVSGSLDLVPRSKSQPPRSKEVKRGEAKGQEILRTLRSGPKAPPHMPVGVAEYQVPATELASWPMPKAPPASFWPQGKGKGRAKATARSTASPSITPHGGKGTSGHRQADPKVEVPVGTRTIATDDWMAGLPTLDSNDIDEPLGPQVFKMDNTDHNVDFDHDETPARTADNASVLSTPSVHLSNQLEDYHRQVTALVAEVEQLRKERDWLRSFAEELEAKVGTTQDAADKAIVERDQARTYGQKLGAKYKELKSSYDSVRAEQQSLKTQLARAQDGLRSQNAMIKSLSENRLSTARPPMRETGLVDPHEFTRLSKKTGEPVPGAMLKMDEPASNELAFRPIDVGASSSAAAHVVGPPSASRAQPLAGQNPAKPADAMTKLNAIFERMPGSSGSARRHGQIELLPDQPALPRPTIPPTVEVPRRRPVVGRRIQSRYQLGTRNITVDISDAKVLAALLTLMALCEESGTAEAVGEFYWDLRGGHHSGLFKELVDVARSRARDGKIEAVLVPWLTNLHGQTEAFVVHHFQLLMSMPTIVSWCDLSGIRDAFLPPGDDEYHDESGLGASWDDADDDEQDKLFCA